MQEFPKIKVQVDNASGNLNTTQLANAAAGTLQNVVTNENDVYQTLVRQGEMTKDITPTLKALRVKLSDIVSIPSGYTYQGKQYGLPLQLTIQTMMINKTLYKQNGVPLPDKTTTWPQWVDMLRRIARPAENIWGYLLPNSWPQWLPFVWGYGGELWTPDLKKATLDTPAAIEGLQLYADMVTRLQIAPPLDAKGAMIPQGVAFPNGNVGGATTSSPGAAMNTSVGGKFEWDIMYTPLGPKTNKRYIFVNCNAVCISNSATRQNVFDQAVQLIAWMTGSKVAQDLIVDIGPAAPVYKPVMNSAKYLAGPPTSQKIVVEMIPDWHDPEIFTGWNDFRDQVSAEFLLALANQKSVPDAAKEMNRLGQIILDKAPK